MDSITYTRAREHLAQVLDQAASGQPVEITRRGAEPTVIISKKEFDAYRKVMLDVEFSQLIGDFDISNKVLADR